MKVVFDMSSLMWTCLLAGKDPEGFEVTDEDGKKVWVNRAAFGYENAINSVLKALNTYKATPIDMIMVFEGMNAKARRLMIFNEYKASRGKRPKEAYDEFQSLRETLKSTFRSLGAIAVTQDNVESDDVIAWLAANIRTPMAVVSNDNDLAVLSGTNRHGVKISTMIGGEIDTNKYGMFDNRFISLYKAMVGDSGDNIKGIKGFGPAAWVNFHAAFGEDGMAELVRLADLGSLSELEEEAEQHPIIKKIWEGRQDFLQSWRLAKLHPEWVDTLTDAPVWEPGMVFGPVTDDRLRHWKAARRMVTADSFQTFLPWFKETAAQRPWLTLDIETSAPEESDDWLAAQGSDGDKVDTIGSELTGMSLTFGANMQYTVYLPVRHKDSNNVSRDNILTLLKSLGELGVEVVIHNTMFEGPVLYNEFGNDLKDNGFEGFVPNWLDTKLEAAYVDEDFSRGLKKLSKRWLGYDQVEYKDVTTIDGVQYKMADLPATHVFDYACDDTVTTAALHNFFALFMNIEGTYEVYKAVEIDASYLHAQSFVNGTNVSIARLKELEAEDSKIYDEAWQTVRDYLIRKGWDGTATPVYGPELTAADIKQAHLIITGTELETRVRTPQKVVDLIADDLLKASAQKALAGDFSMLNSLVASRFNGEPAFNMKSPLQMRKLMYEVMDLPVKLYNKPTIEMRKAGQRQGTPKVDLLAIKYATVGMEAGDERKAVLDALVLMGMVVTRKSLYYEPYPHFVHWKTGKIHASHNQSSTNTRRASESSPNRQQLPKNVKVEGYAPKVREVYVPHKKNAIIVSCDFSSQEILLMAEWSQDPGLLEVFDPENPKDMHAITGVGIFNKQYGTDYSYEAFKEVLGDENHEHYGKAKKCRATGKAVNFGTQYRIAAPKLSTMLMVSEEEAQMFMDAKAEAFPVAEQWSQNEMAQVKVVGKVTTMMGAIRHLREALQSSNREISSKADRQAISFRIQGSAAEQTKLAEGRMWKARLEQRFDAQIIGPIHDEVVASVTIADAIPFIKEMHACMIQQYANMKLKVKSSISLGPDFGRQIEIGEEPTEEAINGGLLKMKEMLEKANATVH